MPKFLVEGRYTSDGLKGLALEGSSRRRADIAKTIESAGGKLEALYFAFGDADFYIIFDAPDNISAAALSVVANQSGYVTSEMVVRRRDGPSYQKDDDHRVCAAGTLTVSFLPPMTLTRCRRCAQAQTLLAQSGHPHALKSMSAFGGTRSVNC